MNQMGLSIRVSIAFILVAGFSLKAEASAQDFSGELSLEELPLSSSQMKATSNLGGGVMASEGMLESVICIDAMRLNVRDQRLRQVVLKASRHESVIPFQSFGEEKLEKWIGGTQYLFIKVKFPEREEGKNIGWVAEDFVQLKSQCSGFAHATTEQLVFTGWTFPTVQRPSSSYLSGMRRFRALRARGRLHAACDLYRVRDEPAVAVASGTVVRGRYPFYQGTYAVEVRHSDGRVVRYGEITARSAAGVSTGSTVNKGQTVGYIGKVNSGCCTPMLHFEMYAGTKSGALSQSGNKFGRRSDLIDPSASLRAWERGKFGSSY